MFASGVLPVLKRRLGSRLGPVIAKSRILDSIEAMSPQRMSWFHERMIEILCRIVRQADLGHHVARPDIRQSGE